MNEEGRRQHPEVGGGERGVEEATGSLGETCPRAENGRRGPVNPREVRVNQRWFLGKILAAFALAQGMNLEVLGVRAGLKGATGVARLTAGWASGLSAQTLGWGGSGRSVEGGRDLLLLFCATESRRRFAGTFAGSPTPLSIQPLQRKLFASGGEGRNRTEPLDVQRDTTT